MMNYIGKNISNSYVDSESTEVTKFGSHEFESSQENSSFNQNNLDQDDLNDQQNEEGSKWKENYKELFKSKHDKKTMKML